MRINWNLMARADYTKPKKILRMLKGMDDLLKLATMGDDTAHAILVDLKEALRWANVSTKQHRFLQLWMDGYTMEEIAMWNRIGKPRVFDRLMAAAKNISKYLEPKKNFPEGENFYPPAFPYYRGVNSTKRPAKRVQTIVEDAGTTIIDGQEYKLTKVKHVCTRCGSDHIEAPIYRRHQNGNLLRVWRCWGCEVNYDIISGGGTKEGLFNE